MFIYDEKEYLRKFHVNLLVQKKLVSPASFCTSWMFFFCYVGNSACVSSSATSYCSSIVVPYFLRVFFSPSFWWWFINCNPYYPLFWHYNLFNSPFLCLTHVFMFFTPHMRLISSLLILSWSPFSANLLKIFSLLVSKYPCVLPDWLIWLLTYIYGCLFLLTDLSFTRL